MLKSRVVESRDFEELDRLAWEAITTWPENAGFDPVLEGIDYSHLSRFFLWDKVGRALRLAHSPENAELELKSYLPGSPPSLGPWEPIQVPNLGNSNWMRQSKLLAKSFVNRARLQNLRGIDVFIPFPHARFTQLVNELLEDSGLSIGLSEAWKFKRRIATRIPYQVPVRRVDSIWLRQISSAIQAGLAAFGVKLHELDRENLPTQLAGLWTGVSIQEYLIKRLKPKLIFVFSDNHPPYQPAVFVAQKYGIDAMQIQHGLDCEHYYLDDAYASFVAVWGPARARAYQARSTIKPSKICVTGNPWFDGIEPRELRVQRSGKWLWVTRPHSTFKCYSPSRSPAEGIEIMRAVCEALKQAGENQELVIKPHPFDYRDEYLHVASEAGVRDQVRLSDQDIYSLFEDCNVVISEDSTAGMEAMLLGKLVVHAHFAATKPTVPFTEYGAALPGFDTDKLVSSLLVVPKLGTAAVSEISEAQKRFLLEFAGPLDSNSSARVIGVIKQQLNSSGFGIQQIPS